MVFKATRNENRQKFISIIIPLLKNASMQLSVKFIILLYTYYNMYYWSGRNNSTGNSKITSHYANYSNFVFNQFYPDS